MTTATDTTTVSEMEQGETQKATWVFKNWKICHSFLTTSSSCMLQMGDLSLRFYLQPLEKTYQLKGDLVKVMKFYSLWVEVLSGQKSLFLNIQTEIFTEPRIIMDNYSSDRPEAQVVLESTSSDSKLLVQERFLYMGSSKIDIYQNRFVEEQYFATCTLVKITFKVTVYYAPGAKSEGNFQTEDDAQSRSLAGDMNKLFIDLTGSANCCHDVELKMEDGTVIPAHRTILAARSPVFRAMFTSGMKESTEKVVPIKKIGSKAMKILLKYMYTDDISDHWGDCGAELLEAANMYDLPELLKFCDKNLIKICNVNNALDLYKLAKLYSLQRAMRQLTEFTKRHTAEVLLNVETG